MSTEWTKEDKKHSYREGWYLSHQIRNPNKWFFVSIDPAISLRYITNRAKTSELHAKAVKLLVRSKFQ